MFIYLFIYKNLWSHSKALYLPAFSIAPLIAMEPSLVAGTVARLPLNEPIGVRTALTITTSCVGE